MAKAWINDRWLKAAQVTTGQGRICKEEPSAYMKHSLSRHTDDPENAKVLCNTGPRISERGRVGRCDGGLMAPPEENCSATTAKLRLSWPRSRTGYGQTGTWIPGTHAGPCGRLRTYATGSRRYD